MRLIHLLLPVTAAALAACAAPAQRPAAKPAAAPTTVQQLAALPKEEQDKYVVCTMEAPVGSNLKSRRCRTRKQLEEEASNNRNALNDFKRTQPSTGDGGMLAR